MAYHDFNYLQLIQGSQERCNGSTNQDFAVTVTTKSMFGRGIREGGCIM